MTVLTITLLVFIGLGLLCKLGAFVFGSAAGKAESFAKMADADFRLMLLVRMIFSALVFFVLLRSIL